MRTSGKTRLALAALLGAVGGGLIVSALSVGVRPHADRQAVETVVHDYLLEHPEILPAAMERLDARKTAAAIRPIRASIERPFAGAWAGAKNGDVVLVEFTDYACGYCRKTVADLDRLLAEDSKLKLVFRELPILSAESEVAARAALVAARDGRYGDLHHQLFAGGQLSQAKIDALAGPRQGAGDPAISAEIERNVELARSLGIGATPSFVVGDQVIAGAVGYEGLKAAVAAARGRG